MNVGELIGFGLWPSHSKGCLTCASQFSVIILFSWPNIEGGVNAFYHDGHCSSSLLGFVYYLYL